MSDTTLAQLVHKTLQEAGYTPVSGQEPGFIVAAEKDGGITISHSLTNDLQHIQAYQTVLKERTHLRVNLVPIPGRCTNFWFKNP